MLPLLSLPFAIAALLVFSNHYVVFRRLLGIALQYPSYRVAPWAAAPLELRQLAAPAVAQLQSLGFRPAAACQIAPLIYQAGTEEWELLLEQEGSFAHVALRYPFEAYAPTKVSFFSFFQDQQLLLTLNGEVHGLIGQLPATTVSDIYSPCLKQQWQHHQQLMCERLIAQPDIALRPYSPQQYARQLSRHFHQYITQLTQRGQIQAVATPPDSADAPQLFQLSVPTAFSCCKNIALRGRKARTLTADLAQDFAAARNVTAMAVTPAETPLDKSKSGFATHAAPRSKPNATTRSSSKFIHPAPSINLPLQTQIQSFERMQRMEQGSVKRPSCDRALFLGSLVLFVVSFRQMFDPTGLLIFVAAIAFHEGGHHWAMRYFGYENTTIFFLPFLGAAATGHKTNASLLEKVCVLLAGPLPGIVLGSLLLSLSAALPPSVASAPVWLGSASSLMHEASIILLGLNFFNLLPIYPLDGGKVVHLLFFARFPYWDALFRFGAVACLLFLSLLSPILLALAGIVALSIPPSLRSAKLHRALQQQTAKASCSHQHSSTAKVQTSNGKRFPKEGAQTASSRQGPSQQDPSQQDPSQQSSHPQDYLVQILLQQQRLGYHRLPFNQRYGLTKDLWERRGESNAQWPTYLSLSLLYLFCLIVAPTGIVLAQLSSTGPSTELPPSPSLTIAPD